MTSHFEIDRASGESSVLMGTEGIWGMALGFAAACVVLSVDGAASVWPAADWAQSPLVFWPVVTMVGAAAVALLLLPVACVRGANQKWSRRPGNRWARWVFGSLGVLMSGGLGWAIVVVMALAARVPS